MSSVYQYRLIAIALILGASILSGCGGTGIRPDGDDAATSASTTGESDAGDTVDSKEAGAKNARKQKFGRLKKRRVPSRPHSNPVINKALGDNLLAARKAV